MTDIEGASNSLQKITLNPLLITGLPVDLYVAQGSDKSVLYVGVTGALQTRMRAHRANDLWWRSARSLTIERFLSRREATIREDALIAEFRPPFNGTNEHRSRIGWWLDRDEDVLVLVIEAWSIQEISRGIGMSVDAVEKSLARLDRDDRLPFWPSCGLRPRNVERIRTAPARAVTVLGRDLQYDTSAKSIDGQTVSGRLKKKAGQGNAPPAETGGA